MEVKNLSDIWPKTVLAFSWKKRGFLVVFYFWEHGFPPQWDAFCVSCFYIKKVSWNNCFWLVSIWQPSPPEAGTPGSHESRKGPSPCMAPAERGCLGSQVGQPKWIALCLLLMCLARACTPQLNFCSCQSIKPPKVICSPQRITGEGVGR